MNEETRRTIARLMPAMECDEAKVIELAIGLLAQIQSGEVTPVAVPGSRVDLRIALLIAAAPCTEAQPLPRITPKRNKSEERRLAEAEERVIATVSKLPTLTSANAINAHAKGRRTHNLAAIAALFERGELIRDAEGCLHAKTPVAPALSAEPRAFAAAEDFLRQTLAAGPLNAEDVKTQAKDAGIAAATLKRAKKRIARSFKRHGPNGVWIWALNHTAGATP